jgi:subtilisin family serine protease
MWHQSSCVNPYSEHGDREKPEVAAPGTSINTTVPLTEDPDGWNNGGTGTSYAAPVVAAEAAMVIQRQPSLAPWPEIVKAIIMASAPHDVSGDGPWIQPSIDQRDGVGGVWLPWADELARGARGGWRGFNYTCASPSPLNLMTMNLTAGRRIRAVIDWAHNTSAASWTYHPSADLDLYILNPSGAVVAKSESWDNTYEIVQFTPAVSGTHTLRVVRAANRCFKDPWRLAGAWSPI